MGSKAFASSFINKFIFLKTAFNKNAFRLLDVGAGNHSATKAKTVFPDCEYYGLDISKDYNNTESDFKLMAGFYEVDLTKLDFVIIPDNFFDAITMVHVIEHLYNGDEVLKLLTTKLKSAGYIYLEYPGKKSTTLPSMFGTLNFKDDPTHVRLYSIEELANILESAGFKVIKKGTRRNIYFILAMPVRIVGALVRGKKLQGNIFWDILGFAEFVWARKNS